MTNPPISAERITCRADYDRLRRTFRWDCSRDFNFGFDVVDRWAETDADRPALFWVGQDEQRSLTFAQLADRSARLARGLLALDLSPSDRVMVILPRMVAWWETLVALSKAGFVALPATSLLTSKDIEYRLDLSAAAAVITDADGAEKVDALGGKAAGVRRILVGGRPRVGWTGYEELFAAPPIERAETRCDQPALLYFTSGTTGMPKMVLHTQASYGLGHQVTGRFWLDLGPGDLHWNVSDTGWAKAAWSSLFGPWIYGATVFAQHAVGKFHPSDVLRYLEKYPVTTLCAAPTIYRWLVQLDLSRFRPAALRHCVAAGEPLNPEVIATWKKATGLTIRDGYGQTETVLLCANFPGVDVKPGSMGLPTPGFDLSVIDDAGLPVPTGREGDLAVKIEPERPLGLFNSYWRDEEATKNAFRQGWYRTGDCGRIDEDGYFWFVGRGDDVITSAAYRIGPFEVESALIEHPAVVEAAVVGKPDPFRGAIVMAFVVLARGFDPTDELKLELQEHVKRTTAPYKYPRAIEFVGELPKTVSGKIRRVELRRRAAREGSQHE